MRKIAALRALLSSGMSPAHGPETNKQIEFCNRLSLTAAAMCLLFAIFERLLGELVMSTVDLCLVIFFLVPIFLQRQRYVRGAHIFFILFGNFYLFYCSAVQGEHAGIHLGLFPMVGLPLVLLTKETLWVQTPLSLLPVALYSWLELTNFRPLLALPYHPAPPAFFYGSVLGAFFLCYIFLKYLDEIYRSYNRRMEALVEDLKHEKQKTLQQQEQLIASAKMAALGEMAGGVAHEINNPLASIQLLSSQIILVQKAAPDAAKTTEVARKIQSVVAQISRIVEALGHFAKKGEIKGVQRVALGKLIHEIVDLCSIRFKSENIELEFAAASEVYAACDPVTLTQVLLNLLNNAFDACRSTGRTDHRVRITLQRRGNVAEIAVDDNGCGVASPLRERIFEPFFTTKTVGSGSGLGLSVSRGLIESQGGRLRLGSGSEGARFNIELLSSPDA